jgi:hypothetical protein
MAPGPMGHGSLGLLRLSPAAARPSASCTFGVQLFVLDRTSLCRKLTGRGCALLCGHVFQARHEVARTKMTHRRAVAGDRLRAGCGRE